ncbi:hypothetical protein L1987_12222 [Smallanthus sonchifolius]|uniref:Uncharacterized protein n=1 Tax=Smallanthus sonchifolius TaxID=185202 RepID=A0ACB9JFH2_9ASTR|nr:hypothetical protein L1987_12222 [Smallanthus sonchifolius]
MFYKSNFSSLLHKINNRVVFGPHIIQEGQIWTSFNPRGLASTSTRGGSNISDPVENFTRHHRAWVNPFHYTKLPSAHNLSTSSVQSTSSSLNLSPPIRSTPSSHPWCLHSSIGGSMILQGPEIER